MYNHWSCDLVSNSLTCGVRVSPVLINHTQHPDIISAARFPFSQPTCEGRLICPQGRVSSLNKCNPIQSPSHKSDVPTNITLGRFSFQNWSFAPIALLVCLLKGTQLQFTTKSFNVMQQVEQPNYYIHFLHSIYNITTEKLNNSP